MPTLIRLFVFLLLLGGLGLAGMYALTIMVDPGEKDITIKIPARDLVPASQPIDLNNLPAPANIAPKDSSSSVPDISAITAPPSSVDAEPSIDTTDSAASQPGVKTVDVGGGE